MQSEGQLHVLKEHNHTAEAYPKSQNLRSSLTIAAQDDLNCTCKRTLCGDMTRNHSEAARATFPQIESSVRRAQAKNRLNIPENMAELVQMLQTQLDLLLYSIDRFVGQVVFLRNLLLSVK